MAQEYKIAAVSQNVRSFDTQYGSMKSYKLKLEGFEQVVELAQKAETPAPVQGQSLFGTIDMSGQYGPKFKKERPQMQGGGGSSFGGGGGSKPSYQPKDEKAIQAMWAIGQAVTATGPMAAKQEVADYAAKAFDVAVELFNMVDMVKNNGLDKEDGFGDAPKSDLETVADIMGDDAPIDVSEIPF